MPSVVVQYRNFSDVKLFSITYRDSAPHVPAIGTHVKVDNRLHQVRSVVFEPETHSITVTISPTAPLLY